MLLGVPYDFIRIPMLFLMSSNVISHCYDSHTISYGFTHNSNYHFHKALLGFPHDFIRISTWFIRIAAESWLQYMRGTPWALRSELNWNPHLEILGASLEQPKMFFHLESTMSHSYRPSMNYILDHTDRIRINRTNAILLMSNMLFMSQYTLGSSGFPLASSGFPPGCLWVLSQLSVLSSQLSALSSELSTLSSQLSTLSSRLSAQLSALNSQLSTLSSQLSTLSYQLSALNSQLSAPSS